MHRRSRKTRGVTLLEALIYVLISSIVVGILLAAFVGSKKVLESMRRQQNKIDVIWRLSSLYDYLEGSVTNLLTPLQRVYKISDEKIYIIVVSPYDTPYTSLSSAPDGFYGGECSNGTLSLLLVKAGEVQTIEGTCSASSYYRLGHSGLAAFARLRMDGSVRVLDEGVGTGTFPTPLGEGTFSLVMKKSDGTQTNDSRTAAYIGIRFSPEGLEISSWKEE